MSSKDYVQTVEVFVQIFPQNSSVLQASGHSEEYDATETNLTETDYYIEYQDYYRVVWNLQVYFIPVICGLGIIGNLSSVVVFVTGAMKNRSSIMFLITKCISDSLFLTALTIVWLDLVQVRWFHHHGICQMVVFISYVSGFFSVWLVVLVTVENYIHICHPDSVKTLCTPGKARAALLFLGIFSIFCYNFPLWTTYSMTVVSRRQCLPLPEFSLFNEGLTYFDTVITLVLPSLLIFLFMAGILSALFAAYWRERKGRPPGRQRRLKQFWASPYGRLTVMLTAVSVIFITLHTPSHIIRLRLLIGQLQRQDATISDILLQRLFELFYYINFALNSTTYLLFGKSFRCVYKRFFCRVCCIPDESHQNRDSESAQNVCETTPNVEKESDVVCEDDALAKKKDHKETIVCELIQLQTLELMK